MKKRMQYFKAIGLTGLASLFAVALVGLFAGCQTTQQPNYVVTEIISEPPGAKIEVNGNYIGNAPVKTKIRTHRDGVVLHRTVIRAIPTESGHFVQKKVFHAPRFPFDNRDQAPHRVFFDMTLKPSMGGYGVGMGPAYKKTEGSPAGSGDDIKAGSSEGNGDDAETSSDESSDNSKGTD